MSYFTNLIYEYGLMAMFFIIMIEYACFPISSEIVLPFSGAVASIQNISFFTILPVSILAGLIGTSFCYLVGRIGGATLIHAIIKKFPKAEKGLNASYEKFNKHGAIMVCVGRLIPICRTYIAIIAGAAKLNPFAYFSGTIIGITVWNTLLIGLGYTLQENYKLVAAYYNQYKHFIVPILLLLAATLIIKLIFRKKSQTIKEST
ncbi:MAG: hypothetical protein K0S47_3297 [Herbinix sp.]|jgi:membrane protein DedA with SNARE-associated domain|nr:hypothetical protein [Herbinix sp.]